MDNRLKMQTFLEELLGSRNVYFQPPSSVLMKYPAIVYTIDDFDNAHANNGVYSQAIVYSVTVIDRDPESKVTEKISRLPKCRFDRRYIANNLTHDVFTLSI